MKADRVFKNAKVYSVEMDGTETRAEAVAIKDGKFIFVGSDADVQDYIDEKTVVTDCQGGSILPGFGDAHMHIAIAVRRFGVADLNGILKDQNQTPEELVLAMQKVVKEFAEQHPNDPVIHGSGWDRSWFLGSLGGQVRHLSRHDIDAVVSDRPVVLDSACGHAILLNTKALEVAGITKDTPDPQEGIIRREADGTPDGYFQEPPVILSVCGKIPNYDFTYDQYKDAFLKAQDFFGARGFTYLCDCLEQEQSYNVIKDVAKAGDLKVRVDGVFSINDSTREQDLENAIAKKKAGTYDVADLCKIDTVKYFLDGNFAMMEPYTDEYCKENGLPKGTGTTEGLLWDIDHYQKSLEDAQKAGFNIHVHSFGDRAANETITAMEKAQKYDPEHKLRNIIAHIFFIQQEDIKRLADANIIASIQPQWECANEIDSKPILDMVGPERFKYLYRNRSLRDQGIVCAYGSDFTVTLPNALEGITTAMTRRFAKSHQFYNWMKDVPVLNPDEAVSLKDAIMGWTIYPAYQFHREELTGSIKVGKSAELVLLDRDIENTKPEDICLINVKETLFKGQNTYKSDQ